MNKFTLKYNALLNLNIIDVQPRVEFDGNNLERKSEFHITIINYGTQRRVLEAGYNMEQIGSVIQSYIDRSINIHFQHGKSIILHREPSCEMPHEEISVIKLLKKEPWMVELIGELNGKFPGVGFPHIYPHITTHSKNGFGIAVQRYTDILDNVAGSIELD